MVGRRGIGEVTETPRVGHLPHGRLWLRQTRALEGEGYTQARKASPFLILFAEYLPIIISLKRLNCTVI